MTRNAGVLTFFSAFWRPLRTSWLIVGNAAPYYTRKVGHTIGETELWEYSKEFRDRQMTAGGAFAALKPGERARGCPPPAGAINKEGSAPGGRGMARGHRKSPMPHFPSR